MTTTSTLHRLRRSFPILALLLAPLIGVLTTIGGSWVPIAVVGIVALVAILLRSPFVGLLAVVFFLPFERLGAYESTAGTIRASQVIALLTLGVWAFQKLMRATRDGRRNPLLLPFAAFLVVNIVGLTVAENDARALTVFLLTAFSIGVSLLIPELVTTTQRLRIVVGTLLVSGALVSIFGLFQFLGDMAGLPATITGLRELYTKDVFGFPRVQSTALEPLYFANYLLLPLGCLYALFLARRSPFPRWLTLGLLALLALNLALTVSRGGYLGFVAMALVVTMLGLREFLRLRTALPLVVGALLVVAGVFQALRYQDVAGINIETFTAHIQNAFWGASYNERIETFEQAVAAFRSSPLIGVGPGNFGPWVAQHPLLEPEGGWRIVNNETLELLAETGILGFLGMGFALFMLLLRSVKAFRASHDQETRAILLGLFGAAAGVFVQYQTFSTLYIMHVWVMIGLLVATQNLLLYGERRDP